ncbi:hypothetical protein D3P09_02355 [Paenibacillus pinisoli]|uniref:Uncharacterized protein n=1 Tax=Paenibacillus pinisoli TaxID=1276110 RepID=A0A3A6PMC0_9BACL|nr:hypothetical protein [Paenibacillus pinisoli]RJX40886.1 hypothetical protein D3P09_02355 [Paenibacillus pinisoli]
MIYYYLLLAVSAIALFTELRDFRKLKKKIYRNMTRNEKNDRDIRQDDIMTIYYNYKSLDPDVLQQAKLCLRAIEPDTVLKNAITTIFTVLPIVLAMMAIITASSAGLLDPDSQLKQLSKEIENMEMLSAVVIAVSFIYSIHLAVDQRRRKLLQLHLTAVAEVERKESK